MKCEICGKEILRDSQCINYKYYHNDCIENLLQENKKLKEIIKENTILVKDKYGDYQECNINPLGMKQKYKKQVDNWNKLKEYINIKLYNAEYLQKLCGCRIDDEIHMTLDIIKKKMQELEKGSGSDVKD